MESMKNKIFTVIVFITIIMLSYLLLVPSNRSNDKGTKIPEKTLEKPKSNKPPKPGSKPVSKVPKPNTGHTKTTKKSTKEEPVFRLDSLKYKESIEYIIQAESEKTKDYLLRTLAKSTNLNEASMYDYLNDRFSNENLDELKQKIKEDLELSLQRTKFNAGASMTEETGDSIIIKYKK
jgi:hypothetical protein